MRNLFEFLGRKATRIAERTADFITIRRKPWDDRLIVRHTALFGRWTPANPSTV